MGDGAAARAVSGPWPAGAGVAHGLSDGGFSVSTEPTTPKPLAICYSPSRKTRCSGTTTPEMPATCGGQSGHLSVVQEVGTTVRHGPQGVKYRAPKDRVACRRAVGWTRRPSDEPSGREDEVDHPAHERDHQAAEQRCPEAVDVERHVEQVRDPGGEKQHERVDDEGEQAECDD